MWDLRDVTTAISDAAKKPFRRRKMKMNNISIDMRLGENIIHDLHKKTVIWQLLLRAYTFIILHGHEID